MELHRDSSQTFVGNAIYVSVAGLLFNPNVVGLILFLKGFPANFCGTCLFKKFELGIIKNKIVIFINNRTVNKFFLNKSVTKGFAEIPLRNKISFTALGLNKKIANLTQREREKH